MAKQLLLFHTAMSHYFSGNQEALEESMKQFSAKVQLKNPPSSWIEQWLKWEWNEDFNLWMDFWAAGYLFLALASKITHNFLCIYTVILSRSLNTFQVFIELWFTLFSSVKHASQKSILAQIRFGNSWINNILCRPAINTKKNTCILLFCTRI